MLTLLEAHVLFPTVVVAGKLFRCTMDDNTSDIEIVEIDRGILVWRNQILGQRHSLIHIVTQDDLSSFASDAAATIEEIKNLLDGDARESFEEQLAGSRRQREKRVPKVDI